MTFKAYVEYLSRLEKMSSRLEMTEELGHLIESLKIDEVRVGIYLSQGLVGPAFDNKEFGMASKMVLRSVAMLTEMAFSEVETKYKECGDIGQVIVELRKHDDGKELSIVDVYQKLREVAYMGGLGSQEKKVELLARLVSSLSIVESKYLLRMVVGKLRLGFSEKTIFDALSTLENGDKNLRKVLDKAYQYYPDSGYIVEVYKREGVMGISSIKSVVGVPVVSALCQRLNEYKEIVKKMSVVGVEKKFDGSRVQIHFKRLRGFGEKSKDSVWIRTFTRNLEENSQMFPELKEIASFVDADEFILDSEAVGFDKSTGEILPFQVTITRKRKHGIDKISEKVPLKFFVFDILSLNGKNLMSLPYFQRREVLNKVIRKNGVLVVDEVVKTDNEKEIETLHEKFLEDGFEGAVIKKWDGKYLPGRQGWNWVKIKEAEGSSGKLVDTLDLAILGYYFGRGKRTNFGMGAFLVGTKKEDSWVSLAKIGTGLTDEEFKGLTERLRELKLDKKRDDVDVEGALVPDVWVLPKVVVEIAADELTKSPSHAGGLALRFPRLVHFRDDKSIDQVTSWEEILQIKKNS